MLNIYNARGCALKINIEQVIDDIRRYFFFDGVAKVNALLNSVVTAFNVKNFTKRQLDVEEVSVVIGKFWRYIC